MTTIVIPYHPGPDDGLELRYTLRGIAKYCQFPHQVILTGTKPKWASIDVIEVDNPTDINYFQNMNTQRKLMAAAQSPLVTEEFIYMHDDMIFLNPVTLDDIKVVRANDNMRGVMNFNRYNRNAGGLWKKLMRKTYVQLMEEGFPTWSYETHLPRFMTKTDVRVAMRKYDMLRDAWQMCTLILNNVHKAPEMELLKVKGGDYKLTAGKRWTVEDYMNKVKHKKVLSIYNAAYTKELKRFLSEYLQEPSPYEQ